MNLLKNRKFAALIAVVVIIAATVFGMNRSVTRAVNDIERVFYDGALNAQGFREPSANAQLDRIAAEALGLATLLQNRPELDAYTQAVLVARRVFMDAQSVSEKIDAYWGLYMAFVELVHAADAIDLTEREQDGLEAHVQAFTGAHAILAREGQRYNDLVIELRDDMAIWVRRMIPDRQLRFPKMVIAMDPFLNRGIR